MDQPYRSWRSPQATAVLATLAVLLTASACSEPAAAWTEVPRAELTPVPEEGSRALLCRYEPGLPFKVLLARDTEPPVQGHGLTIPLADDELFARSQSEPALRGHFADALEARVEIPDHLLADGPVYAALLVHTPSEHGLSVSEPVRVR